MQFKPSHILALTYIVCSSNLAISQEQPTNNPNQNSNGSNISFWGMKIPPMKPPVSSETDKGGINMADIKQQPTKNGHIKSITYTRGGGMLGDYHHTELKLSTNPATIEIEDSPVHSEPRKKYSAVIDDNTVARIRELLAGKDILAWSKAPSPEFFALDAPTSSIHFYVDQDPYSIHFNLNKMLSEEDSKVLREVMSVVQDLEKEVMK